MHRVQQGDFIEAKVSENRGRPPGQGVAFTPSKKPPGCGFPSHSSVVRGGVSDTNQQRNTGTFPYILLASLQHALLFLEGAPPLQMCLRNWYLITC